MTDFRNKRNGRARPLVLGLITVTLSVALTVLAWCPATWIVPLLENATAGRLTLGDAQGTLWHGSAFVGGAADGNAPITPLLPGRFEWHLSPMVLLGRLDVMLENDAVLSLPVKLTGSWFEWQLSPAAIGLPAERLATLGAPLNTIQPSGRMSLSWSALQIALRDKKVDVTGSVRMEMREIASRLSPIKPLGSYDLSMDWQGQQATLILKTAKGPLLLSGSGTLQNGRLQFSGIAEAEPGQEEKLANLLNLLGQRRKQNGRNVIALEFK